MKKIVLISQSCECGVEVTITIQIPPDIQKEMNDPREIARELVCFNCGELMDIDVCETMEVDW